MLRLSFEALAVVADRVIILLVLCTISSTLLPFAPSIDLFALLPSVVDFVSVCCRSIVDFDSVYRRSLLIFFCDNVDRCHIYWLREGKKYEDMSYWIRQEVDKIGRASCRERV